MASERGIDVLEAEFNEIDKILDAEFAGDDLGIPHAKKEDYATHYKTMEHATRLQMDNYLGFVQSADPKSREVFEWMQALIPLGVWQLTGKVNRRYGRLRDLRIQLQGALEVAGHPGIMKELQPSRWERGEIMKPLPLNKDIIKLLDTAAASASGDVSEYLGNVVVPNPARRALDLTGVIVNLQNGIRRDIVAGVFEDYTDVIEHFQNVQEDQVYHAGIIDRFPYFLRLAHSAMEESRAGQRNPHSEALFARMIYGMALTTMSKMRGAQKGRRGKGDDNESDDE